MLERFFSGLTNNTTEPKNKNNNKNTISRRNFLRGAVSIAAMAALEGCAESDKKKDKFLQNFDVFAYKPFTADDYPDRVDPPFTKGQLTSFFETLINKYLHQNLSIHGQIDIQTTNNEFIGQMAVPIEQLRTNLESQGYLIDECSFENEEIAIRIRHATEETTQFMFFVTKKEIVIGTLHNGTKDQIIKMSIDQIEKDPITHTPISVISDIKNGYFTDPDMPEWRIYEVGDGSRAELTKNKGTFELGSSGIHNVSDTNSLITFLQKCSSERMLEIYLHSMFTESINVRDISTIDQLIEIFRLLPKDPMILSAFMQHAFRYAAKDIAPRDDFRAPIDTLRSGWGDCDDYSVINFFWAHLHGYNPNLVYIQANDDSEGHVYIWYANEKKQIVILDNERAQALEPGKTVQDYMTDAWPNWKIMGNWDSAQLQNA